MTPSITAEQRARIARAVTGDPSYQVDSFSEVVTAWQERWDPDFSYGRADSFQGRDQALALVEWLADRIHKRIDGQDNYFRQLLSAIHWRNIEALEQLALELIGDGNG